jgi:hypothetical protein
MNKLFITGPNESICPPCYYCGNEPNPTTKVVKHDQSCPYLIAKDLWAKMGIIMTNEELLATAEVALIKASRRKKDIVDLQRAINTLAVCIKDDSLGSIEFAREVLLTEIEELN